MKVETVPTIYPLYLDILHIKHTHKTTSCFDKVLKYIGSVDK